MDGASIASTFRVPSSGATYAGCGGSFESTTNGPKPGVSTATLASWSGSVVQSKPVPSIRGTHAWEYVKNGIVEDGGSSHLVGVDVGEILDGQAEISGAVDVGESVLVAR